MDVRNKRLSEYLHPSTTTRNFITMQLLSFEARIRKISRLFCCTISSDKKSGM
jgi:hypothetical protein